MADSNEYRSYGSYLGRVFAIMVTVLVLIFAVWFVVQLAQDDDTTNNNTGVSEEVAGIEEGTGQVISDTLNVDGDVEFDEVAGDNVVAANDQPEVGHTLSTTTEALPNTGPSSPFIILGISALSASIYSYTQSRKQLSDLL